MRTKRASRWRSVLFQRSTWAVSPVSRAHSCMLLFQNDRSIDFQKIGEAMAEAILLRNRLPQPVLATWDIRSEKAAVSRIECCNGYLEYPFKKRRTWLPRSCFSTGPELDGGTMGTCSSRWMTRGGLHTTSNTGACLQHTPQEERDAGR
jgi:hypothetical protein